MVAIKSESKPRKLSENTVKHGKIGKKKSKNKNGKIIQQEPVPSTQKNVILTKKKKNRFVMPSESVTEDLVKKSVSILYMLSEQQKKNNRILEEETPIYATICCIKVQNSKGNVRLLFPHSTVASTGEVCLVTADLKKGKKVDHEPTIDHYEELLKSQGVTCVKTVIPMRQLRVEYDQFELKRRLLTQHDFIMVDTRVLTHVSHLLGKKFFKKHNMLIPVRLEKKEINFKEAIDIGMRTAMIRLSLGESSAVLVGHTGMPKQAIVDNIVALTQQLKMYPGGEANVRSISIKTPLSPPLPIYLTLRPCNSIAAPKLERKRPKNYTVLEDELSTIPGKRVSVAPDGTVRLVKDNAEDSEIEKSDDEDKDEDEKQEEDSE